MIRSRRCTVDQQRRQARGNGGSTIFIPTTGSALSEPLEMPFLLMHRVGSASTAFGGSLARGQTSMTAPIFRETPLEAPGV